MKNNEENDNMNNNSGIVATGENFDVQTLMNLMGQNAITVQGLSQQMGIMATKMSSIESNMGMVMSDIDQLKNNEEITTEQVETIKKTAVSRIREILGRDEYTWAKYFRTFIKRIYSDARANAGCGSKVDRTRKCNFQKVVRYMEAWNPDGGVYKLMQIVDERAEARKRARDEGYED